MNKNKLTIYYFLGFVWGNLFTLSMAFNNLTKTTERTIISFRRLKLTLNTLKIDHPYLYAKMRLISEIEYGLQVVWHG